jgi:hypothetical protein
LADPEPTVDRFGLALASIGSAILVSAAVGDEEWGRVLSGAMLGWTLLVVLRTTKARRRIQIVAVIVVVSAVVAAAASVLLGDQDISDWAIPVVGAFLALGAPVAIIRRLLKHRTVTFQTVLGALCLYLLAAMFFAFLYSALDALSAEPFFRQEGSTETIDFLYFSFTTITTTGFGDLTAASDVGRMMAVTEALIGQLYLVTVVALLVGNLGRTRTAAR